MTRLITNSELQTFKRCRRKWWLSVHRRLTPRRSTHTGPLAIGTRIHEALRAYYAGEDAVLHLKNEIDKHRSLLASDPYVTPDEMEQFEKDAQLVTIMLDGYFQWVEETGVDIGLEVVGAEARVEVPSAVKGVNLLGKLDLRVRRELDGARFFIDHKSCGSISSAAQTQQRSDQFKHYQLLELLDALARGEEQPNTQGALVNLLRKVKRTPQAKPPFYHREEVHHSTIEMRSYYAQVHALIREILQLEAQLEVQGHQAAVPTPRRDCQYDCEFYQVCPMFDDGSDAERYLADHYQSYDPLNRYAEKETEA